MRPLQFSLCLLLLTSSAGVAQDRAALLERAGMSRARGAQGASVVVMEISDFQCPFCGRFAREVYPQIDSAYVQTGKVEWVFVNMPLPDHTDSWLAAEAALCAGGTGADFWHMHDQLFRDQEKWSGQADPAAEFRGYAKQAGANLPRYDQCVAGDQVASLVLRDLLYAASTKVTGTPAFIINDDPPVVGVKEFDEWKRLLDAALAK